jgi:hypothetical protein
MPTAEPDPYKKTYTKKHRNPYVDRPSLHKYDTRFIREAHNLHHHPGSLRGPLLNHRKSKKNPHLTDLAAYHKKGGTRRRHRKHRHTRRR